MIPEIKAQWTAALRSGEYQQGKQALKTADGTYCCLGVLCELAVKAGVIEPAKQFKADYAFEYNSAVSFPPAEVCEWAGLEEANPDAGGHSLSAHNDGIEGCTCSECDDPTVAGKSFAEIADLIEAYL
jgi:hypothetical protein